MKGPKTEKIRTLFNSIAKDYDKLNHILSLGVDRTWRKRAIKYIAENKPQQILDIACGTGDFSLEIARRTHPGTMITGLDLSEGMLEVMDCKVAEAGLSKRIHTQQGNSEAMDFEDNSFDRVTIAFGIRNFENRETALIEILRILKPGGRLVILELSVPSNPVLRWCYNLYFTKIVPLIGGAVSGDKAAYRYLPASVIQSPRKEEWMATMHSCGYEEVKHKAFTFGICRMYAGAKQL